ncbi:MAG: lamin tail domain-containing protein [Clostridia bacterium]|nr:lamin tail domain-containing protein [Clostridia bacterium]
MQNKKPTANPARRPQANPTQGARPVPQRPQSRSVPAQRSAARPAQKAPAKAAPASGNKKSVTGKLVVLGVIAFIILSFVLQHKFPNGIGGNTQKSVPAIDVALSIRITEVMSSNGSAVQDENGEFSDWFEVANVSDKPLSLRGYKIAQEATHVLEYFEFPDHTLSPGERTIVFATNTSKNNYGYTYHAPFKISSAGDTLILFNPYDHAIQTLNVPSLSSNHSYAEVGGEWVVTNEYTPRMANTHENYLLARGDRTLTESPIKITEFMAKNASYAPDENGEYVDWIEIFNSSDYAVSLNGYALSDSEENLQKWRFPNVSIGAGEYMIVYASGYDRANAQSALHTNFRLSTEKEFLILTNAAGSMIDYVSYDILKADQSYSRQADDSWTTMLPPTPGKSNSYESAALIDGQFAAQNATGVYFNEVMASTTQTNSSGQSYDWIEIYNRSGHTVDLSGWGISDEADKPRKWQFPDGSSVSSGQYLGVLMSGLDKKEGSYYHAGFKLSSTEGATLVLSMPDGTIVDRVPLTYQYSNISYGRINGQSGFYYMTATTPLTANAQSGYMSRLLAPTFSVKGGTFSSITPFTVSLTAEPGATIYYTLDSSTPDPANLNGSYYTMDNDSRNVYYPSSTFYQTHIYSEPIPVYTSTVIRAIAVKDGKITSLVNTQSYLLGVSHTMDVISLVMDPIDLWDRNQGLYVFGPNALASSPYGSIDKGANFWMSWEKDANIEMYSTSGETLLSQGCGVKLHGQFSRKEAQKAFKIVARSKYGVNRFYYPLFEHRDYTEYQSFVLRSSGQDWDRTRMRDSILTYLSEGSSVMYQDTALAIVYLNGEYWGHYNLRERINTFSICQWEGWDESVKDSMDLLKANTSVMQGSNKDWLEIKEWYEKNGIETEEELAYIKQYIDVDNYLEYIAIQMYGGNPDLLNVKKYKSDEIDGKWRWVLFDTDWGFHHDTNSPNRWLTPGGMGTDKKTDNSLFIALMKNPVCKDQFLTYFAEHLATTWSTENVSRLIHERAALLEPEIDQHLARWNISRSVYDSEMRTMLRWVEKRPGRLLYFFSNLLSESEMQHYFGNILEDVEMLSE